MPFAVGHEAFADVATRGYMHAQTSDRILMHHTQFTTRQPPTLDFGCPAKIHHALAAVVLNLSGIGCEMAGKAVDHGRFAGTGFTHDAQHFTGT